MHACNLRIYKRATTCISLALTVPWLLKPGTGCALFLIAHDLPPFTGWLLGVLLSRIRSYARVSMISNLASPPLRFPPTPNSELEPDARQLLRLLPSQPPTQLLLATLSQLPHRSPESIALAISSLEPAVRRVLGSGLTGPLLDELLLCMDQGISSSTSSSGRSSSGRGSSRRGHNGSTAWLEERLAGIAALLGPELAHGALQLAPGLMRVSQEDLAARMGAISELLQQQQPVDAALLAGRHAQLLLLAPERLFEVGEELRDALGEWLGWPRGKALHFMVWNPHVLVEAAQQPLGGLENRGAGVKGGPSALDSMGMHWEEVRRLAARRERWKAAIGRARYPLVAAALCGNSSSSSGTGSGSSGGGSSSDLGAGADPAAQLQGGRGMESSADAIHDSFAAWVDAQEQRLQRLRYCAETGDLPLLGLRRVLLTHPVEFVSKCSGYRSWRLQQSRSGGGVEVGEGNEGLPAWWYEPQLEVLGELGPYDRL